LFHHEQKSVAAMPLPLPFVPVAEQPVNWEGRKTVQLQVTVPHGNTQKVLLSLRFSLSLKCISCE
jgi:hypothetical protein